MKKILLSFVVFFVAADIYAGKIEVLAVFSDTMKKIVPVVVVRPDDESKTYPVLFLLHGYGDMETTWLIVKPDLDQLAEKYGMIIVCPRAGNSWYWDSPVDSAVRYDTFISNELVNFIDKKYKTPAKREGRAISGLSMGGYGAFYLALKHKDIFGAAGSTSGALDLKPFLALKDIGGGLGIPALLGDVNKVLKDYNIVSLLEGLQNKELELVFDSGYNDNIFSVPLYEINNKVHQSLVERGIEHSYFVYPGAHTIPYWNNSIEYQLLFFDRYFKKSLNDGASAE